MTREKAIVDSDASKVAADTGGKNSSSPISATTHSTVTITATRTEAESAETAESVPNTLTVIGGGTPSSFELTVDGEIELADDDRDAGVTVLSGSTVEGAIETGTITFRFTGELTDVTFVDREITGLSPATTPNVHVDYGAPDRSES